MEQKKLESVLILIIPQVIGLICEKYGWDEIAATNRFYASKVYASLEDKQTKLWHLSPLTLCRMFEEEQERDAFIFPEEV